MPELSALVRQKYSYFRNIGDFEIETCHYMKHYSCASLTNSFLKEEFDYGGHFKYSLEDHDYRYDLKVTYQDGDTHGLGVMVKSIGVFAQAKKHGLKNDGVLLSTTPHFMAGPTSTGQLVFALAGNNQGELPKGFDRSLRIAAGFNNYLVDHGINPRDSTTVGHYRSVFGEGNNLFINYMRLYWTRAPGRSKTARAITHHEDADGAIAEHYLKTNPKVDLVAPTDKSEDLKEVTDLFRQVIHAPAVEYVEAGKFVVPAKGRKYPWNTEFWVSIKYDPDAEGVRLVESLFQAVQRLDTSHTLRGADVDTDYRMMISLGFCTTDKTVDLEFQDVISEFNELIEDLGGTLGSGIIPEPLGYE